MFTDQEKKEVWDFFAAVYRVTQLYNWGRDIAIVIARDGQRLTELVSLLELDHGHVSLQMADFSHVVGGETIPKSISARILEQASELPDWHCIYDQLRRAVEDGVKIIFLRLPAQVTAAFREFLRRLTTNRPEGFTGAWELPRDIRVILLTTENDFENLSVDGVFWQLGGDRVGKALGPWLRI